MADPPIKPYFLHERLDVYRAALEFVRFASELTVSLGRNHRQFRDQLTRASLSIPLNIAEGNGKRSDAERRRFFEIARGSGMECAALLDVLGILEGDMAKPIDPGKQLLHRIVSMLSRMTERPGDSVREGAIEYRAIRKPGEGQENESENDNENENGNEKKIENENENENEND